MEGLVPAVISNYMVADAKGVFVSGAYNHSKGDIQGVAVTGGINHTSGDFEGLGVSLFNAADEELNGLHLGGICNTSRNARGCLIALLNLIDRSIEGFSVGFGNIVRERKLGEQAEGRLSGVHIGGFMNDSYDAKGVTLSTCLNVASRSFEGVAVSAINYAGKSEKFALQVGGFNYLRESDGLAIQIGGVNRCGNRVIPGVNVRGAREACRSLVEKIKSKKRPLGPKQSRGVPA